MKPSHMRMAPLTLSPTQASILVAFMVCASLQSQSQHYVLLMMMPAIIQHRYFRRKYLPGQDAITRVRIITVVLFVGKQWLG